MKIAFIAALFIFASFSQLASSEARGIIRIIERMFPSTPANQDSPSNQNSLDQAERKLSSEQGKFERVDKDFSENLYSKDGDKLANGEFANDAGPEDEGEDEDEDEDESDDHPGVNSRLGKESIDEKEKEDLEISRLEEDAAKNRRSALVIALLSEKKTMRLGLQVFNQSCSKCHGTFQYSKPHMSRRAYRRAKSKSRRAKASSRRTKSSDPRVKDIAPEVDLQSILYKFGKTEAVIERHLVDGLEIMPNHRFENLTAEELRAVTRFVMSIN